MTLKVVPEAGCNMYTVYTGKNPPMTAKESQSRNSVAAFFRIGTVSVSKEESRNFTSICVIPSKAVNREDKRSRR